MVIIYLADGFEEMEALAPADILRRAGVEVVLAGVTGMTVTGAHGIKILADIDAKDADYENAEMVFLPGGGTGSKNLDSSEIVDKAINYCYNNGIRLAAICAAPFILGKRGFLKGKKAVCFPGFEEQLTGAELQSEPVVTDGLITTGKSAGWAKDFGLELVAVLKGEKAKEALQASMDAK